eukprot:scaffold30948_cov112-Isochrysis_galbana.AAC.3
MRSVARPAGTNLARNKNQTAAVWNLARNKNQIAAVSDLARNKNQTAAVSDLARNKNQKAAVSDLARNENQIAAVSDLARNTNQIAAVSDLARNKNQIAALPFRTLLVTSSGFEERRNAQRSRLKQAYLLLLLSVPPSNGLDERAQRPAQPPGKLILGQVSHRRLARAAGHASAARRRVEQQFGHGCRVLFCRSGEQPHLAGGAHHVVERAPGHVRHGRYTCRHQLHHGSAKRVSRHSVQAYRGRAQQPQAVGAGQVRCEENVGGGGHGEGGRRERRESGGRACKRGRHRLRS